MSVTEEKTAARATHHFDGLDGLKGLAIIAIVLYHLSVVGFGGGFIFVDVFFAISGFLACTGLLRRLSVPAVSADGRRAAGRAAAAARKAGGKKSRGVSKSDRKSSSGARLRNSIKASLSDVSASDGADGSADSAASSADAQPDPAASEASAVTSPHATTRHIVVRYYVSRLRRLYPALLVVTCSTVCLAWFLCREALSGALSQVVGALTFTYNWVDVASGTSYFAGLTPEPLKHMWFVSLLVQFFVVAPLLVLLLRPLARHASWAPPFILMLLAVASAAGMAMLWDPEANPTRVYFGTDTHCFSLLLGMALGWCASDRALASALRGDRARRVIPVLSALSLAGIIAALFVVRQGATAFRGGLALVGVLSLIVIVGLLQPGTWFERLLSVGPLVHLGRRSYGIYLWHYPLYIIAVSAWSHGSLAVTVLIDLAVVALSLVLTRVVALLFAGPVSREGFRGLFLSDSAWSGTAVGARTTVAFVMVLALVSSSCAALMFSPCMSQTQGQLEADQVLLKHTQAVSVNSDQLQKKADGSGSDSALSSAFDNQISAVTTLRTNKAQEESEEAAAQAAAAKKRAEEQRATQAKLDPETLKRMPSGDEMTMIGDSVMLGASPSVLSKFPGAYIDAAVSRHFGDGLSIVQNLQSSGSLRSWVVVGLGTNGTVTEANLEAMDSAIGSGHNLVLVTAYAPRNWIDPSNATVRAYAQAHSDHVVLVEWDKAIGARTDLLLADGFHPQEPDGGNLYADTLYSGIATWLADHPES